MARRLLRLAHVYNSGRQSNLFRRVSRGTPAVIIMGSMRASPAGLLLLALALICAVQMMKPVYGDDTVNRMAHRMAHRSMLSAAHSDGAVPKSLDKESPYTGSPNTGSPNTGSPNTGSPNTGSPTKGSPNTGSPNTGSPNTGSPSKGNPSKGSPSTDIPNTGSPSKGNPSKGSPSTDIPNTGSPNKGSPGKGSPGTDIPNTGSPNKGSPGKGSPGTDIPNTGSPSEASSTQVATEVAVGGLRLTFSKQRCVSVPKKARRSSVTVWWHGRGGTSNGGYGYGYSSRVDPGSAAGSVAGSAWCAQVKFFRKGGCQGEEVDSVVNPGAAPAAK
ncbi:unnamed protein product [Closterium sp. Yama58-4]|nr:unnamed protein product [Closterium sp. Yama58-4]